jgi:hypothetical protein
MEMIFTVSSFNLKKSRKSGIDWEAVERCRCVGYFLDFETAERCVLINNMDISENEYYSHVVIEQVEPGMYPTMPLDHRWFYGWDGEQYVKLENFDDPHADVTSYVPIG